MRIGERVAGIRFRVAAGDHNDTIGTVWTTPRQGRSRRNIMRVMTRFWDYLAERRERRRRYAETLELLSLPVEIQKDIIRPERTTRPVPRREMREPRLGA
jgi:hypothetical protein